MTRPAPKGWCPGAHRPMMSGDGLVVRVRPRLARLTAEQALGLCEAAQTHGNGIIDLTSRANLQVRGVSEAGHPALLADLEVLGLLDHDPALEGRRNILISPLWAAGDDTARIAAELTTRLGELPDLPAKFGFAVDTGDAPMFGSDSADIRVERDAAGGLILRADGAARGVSVTPESAVDHLIRLAQWFADSGGETSRRMVRHLSVNHLPDWAEGQVTPVKSTPPIAPGETAIGPAFGAPFGQIDAAALAQLIRDSRARALRVTPWRVFLLEGAKPIETADFVTDAENPLMSADACPGAPLCTSASVETRQLAAKLAPHVTGRLHVSGCAKGCARPRPADVTLVGNNGHFDLVNNGHSWDAPQETGLDVQTLLRRFGAR